MNEEYRIQNKKYKRDVQQMGDNFCVFKKEYQMDVLESFLLKDLKGRTGVNILDACCGKGRLIHYLYLFDPTQIYSGFDYVSGFVKDARRYFRGKENISIFTADIYSLPRNLKKKYEITILYKTLGWIPDYPRVLKSLFRVTKEKVYITSPFYRGEINFEVKADILSENKKKISRVHYIYGMPSFEKKCLELGAQSVIFHDLSLPFPIAPSENPDILHTHTVQKADGTYMELTNIIKLDWKLVEISM